MTPVKSTIDPRNRQAFEDKDGDTIEFVGTYDGVYIGINLSKPSELGHVSLTGDGLVALRDACNVALGEAA